jgi:hypothetical protein
MDTLIDSTPPDNMTAFDTEPLTQSLGHSERCANPFCNHAVGAKGRYCSDRCRMDGYVLRRAKALLHEVGLIEFYERLHQVK